MKKFLRKSWLTITIAAVTLVIGGLSGFILGQNFSRPVTNQNFPSGTNSQGGYFNRRGNWGNSDNSDNSQFPGMNGNNGNNDNSNSDSGNSNSDDSGNSTAGA